MTTPNVCNGGKDCTSTAPLGVDEPPRPLMDRMEKMEIQAQPRRSRRQRQNSSQGGGVLLFFDQSSDSIGDGVVDKIVKPAPQKLSRAEQRRMRLEQMRRSRTSSISSMGSSVPTLEEEEASSPNAEEPKEDARASMCAATS